MTLIRSTEWKLVHYLEDTDGELYNLIHDPGEHPNLWEDPPRQEVKLRLLREMLKWSLNSSLQTAKWSEAWR